MSTEAGTVQTLSTALEEFADKQTGGKYDSQIEKIGSKLDEQLIGPQAPHRIQSDESG